MTTPGKGTSNAIDALLTEGLAEAQAKSVQEKEDPKTTSRQPTLAVPNLAPNTPTDSTDIAKKHAKHNLSESKGINPGLNKPAAVIRMDTEQLRRGASGPLPTKTTNPVKKSNERSKIDDQTSESNFNCGEPNCSRALSSYGTEINDQASNMHSPAKQLAQGATLQTRNVYDDDDYQKDVELWLQLTGFYDSVFREQRLRTHKRRAGLLERKRLVDQELAELEQQEAAVTREPNTLNFMRAQSVMDMPPPNLPASAMTSVESTPGQVILPHRENNSSLAGPSAGTKRPHSPEKQPRGEQPAKLSRLDTSVQPRSRDKLLDKPLSAGHQKHWSTQR